MSIAVAPAPTPAPTESARGGAGRTRAPAWLVVHAVAIGVVFALPGVFVLVRAGQLGSDVWPTVREALGPLGRTALLASSVAMTAALLGTVLAWLVTRTDLAGRSVWQVLLVLPLVLPSFVGAAAFLASTAPGGLLQVLGGTVGITPPRLRGFWPSWLLLSLLTYPYVLLPVGARLLALRPSLEESARLLGRTAFGTFRSVTLPHLRSSILASSLLVFLYTVSEFGAVQLLGYDTLTRVIFATRLVDRGTSFTAAALLILLALVVVAGERLIRSENRSDDRAAIRRGQPVPLGRYGLLAQAFVGLVVLGALITPIASLATWAIRGLVDGRVDVVALIMPAINTALVGAVTAAVAVAVVLPLAMMLVRHRSPTGQTASVAVVGGFAVPGLVIALSLVYWSLNTPLLDRLYQTMPVLILAYVIHFGSQALGAAESSVRAVPQELRESARLLEPSPGRRAVRVDYPLMRPGLVSGAGLVLLSTIKELPATLLLAPIGFSTLATEIWGSYQDGFFAEVGVASLALVALSAVLTWWLSLRRRIPGRS